MIAAPWPCAAQETGFWSLTIQMKGGALLVKGPEDAVKGLQARIGAERKDISAPEAAEIARKDFPTIAEVLVFNEAEIPVAGDVRQVELPLRRAILHGMLPPIEGLSMENAREALIAAGITSAASEEWAAMSHEEKAALAGAPAGRIAVLSGTSPHDAVKVIFIDEKKER